MAALYSSRGLKDIEAAFKDLNGRCLRLQERWMALRFANEDAREYALHGFARRLKTLVQCIQNTFCALPPELEGIPCGEATRNAEINIQAFLTGVFGCLDNLARVWVLERNVTQQNGEPIPSSWIGLRPGNEAVRNKLSPGLRAYLEGMKEWFEYLEDFRHALAHRIPLYIPPFAVTDANRARYQELDALITDAVLRRAPADSLRREQDGLKVFHPVMQHSWHREKPWPVPFHRQILSDFMTVEGIATRMLDDLEAFV